MARQKKLTPKSLFRRTAAGASLGLACTCALAAARYRRTAAVGYVLDEPPPPGGAEFSRLMEALGAVPLRQGNRVRIMRNGCETFPAMMEAIASAERTVDFSSYIYWPSDIVSRFGDALIERAAAGIEVNVVLDGWGSMNLPRDEADRLERSGVNFAWFRPPRWYTLHKMNNRMHRRILVVDGRVGFTGGVGIAEPWEGNAEDGSHWRETHARIEGPAVRDLLGAFQESWTEATQRVLTGAHLPELSGFDDGVAVQVTRSSPIKGTTSAEKIFYAAIIGAQKRLWITTAYFVPREAFVGALCTAAGRGVDVQVLVNGPNIDKEVVREAGQYSYGRLLASGVRIFEYQKARLHAKVMVVDSNWGNFGSSNFDNRSFSMQDEINVALKDPGLTSELENHFLQDLEVSEELDLDRWSRRPLAKRIRESASQLARPFL